MSYSRFSDTFYRYLLLPILILQFIGAPFLGRVYEQYSSTTRAENYLVFTIWYSLIAYLCFTGLAFAKANQRSFMQAAYVLFFMILLLLVFVNAYLALCIDQWNNN
jgi:cell division protein FtsW (lipid II flippase)